MNRCDSPLDPLIINRDDFNGLSVSSVMAASSRLAWLRLATSSSARFGSRRPNNLCERFPTSSSGDHAREQLSGNA
jgi:hypothetical protein